MCGIFGIIRATGVTDLDETAFHGIGEGLRHRGPDGSGYIEEPRIRLGMHRLSIMDVAHGWQPFWSEDGTVGALGNGEIYNAESLRRLLEDRGHVLRTRSDIEVVPHLFEEYGPDFVHRLRGMFALVLFDKTKDRVLLVRDRLGEKPLSWVRQNGAVYFASEQTALVRAGVIGHDFDTSRLADYLLHGFSPEPASLLKGVSKVPAGGIVEIPVSTGVPETKVYWRPLDFVDRRPFPPEELVSDLRDAVTVSTVSDVPVGIALSGGLDSSLVASLAHSSGVNLQAFTVGYPDARFDESGLAQDYARSLGIPCHRVELGTAEIAEKYATISSIRDEPIADIAGPGLAAVPEVAREHGVPVLLTGLGGDELFWGYEWVNRLAQWSWLYLAEAEGVGRVPRFTARPSNRQALVDWLTTAGGYQQTHDLRSLMSSTPPDSLPPLPFYQRQPGYREQLSAISSLTRGQAPAALALPPNRERVAPTYVDALLQTFLLTNGLTQLDRLSMHYSIESRVPLVDHVLVERVMSSALADDGFTLPAKARLREAAAKLLPREITNRPKRGFTPPVREWMTEIWRRNPEATRAHAITASFGGDPHTAQRLMRRPVHPSGRVNQMGLRLLTLELWLQAL